MSAFRQTKKSALIGGALAIGLGASLHAQTQLADPKDAPRIFATTCSACHKSPAGLAKSGQVAGFLRQHYTTGPEMSAAMAAYLVSAGSGPASRKGQAEAKAKEQPGDNPAAKAKARKQEQAAAQPSERSPDAKNEPRNDAKNAKESRTLRKQLQQQAKAHEERPAVQPSPASAAEPATQPAAAAPSPTLAEANPVPAAAPAAAPAAPPLMTLDIPLPEMPTAPPADLNQSAFSSSPVP